MPARKIPRAEGYDWDARTAYVPTRAQVQALLDGGYGVHAIRERWGHLPSTLLKRAPTDSRRKTPSDPA